MKLRDLIPQHINESMTDMQLEDAIDEFLADDMSSAFELTDVDMPEELDGPDYEEKMDQAREELKAFFKANPMQQSEYGLRDYL